MTPLSISVGLAKESRRPRAPLPAPEAATRGLSACIRHHPLHPGLCADVALCKETRFDQIRIGIELQTFRRTPILSIKEHQGRAEIPQEMRSGADQADRQDAIDARILVPDQDPGDQASVGSHVCGVDCSTHMAWRDFLSAGFRIHWSQANGTFARQAAPCKSTYCARLILVWSLD